MPGIPASAGGPAQYVQIVLANGQRRRTRRADSTLPVDVRARWRSPPARPGTTLTDVHVGEDHLRMLTFAVTVAGRRPARDRRPAARPAAERRRRRSSSNLRLILALLLARRHRAGRRSSAGWPPGGCSRRWARSPQAAQHIGETDDLTGRIRVHADDEVGQLATRFNPMLDRLEGSRAALDESVRAQRQLVADASHELRTPVTSLRTNIEVLLEGGELEPEDRRRLLADVVEQSEELSALVGDLIELARGDQPGPGDRVRPARPGRRRVGGARAPQRARDRVRADLSRWSLDGVPERLGRAINNLLDNAARHSPPGGVVEVTRRR